MLRRRTRFAWTRECQQAFEKLKTYLSSSPLLTRPLPQEDLYLYLVIADETMVVVLVREVDRATMPIYYVNKALQIGELNYSRIKKLAFTLVMAARKL